MVARVQQQGMPQGALDAVFASVVTVRILRYLCQAGGSHTGRAIAKAVALSHTAVSRTLQHLAESELVDLRPVGRAIVGSFNRDHWLAAALAGLFQAEQPTWSGPGCRTPRPPGCASGSSRDSLHQGCALLGAPQPPHHRLGVEVEALVVELAEHEERALVHVDDAGHFLLLVAARSCHVHGLIAFASIFPSPSGCLLPCFFGSSDETRRICL